MSSTPSCVLVFSQRTTIYHGSSRASLGQWALKQILNIALYSTFLDTDQVTQMLLFYQIFCLYIMCYDFNFLNETLVYFSLSFVYFVAFNLPTFAKGKFEIYQKNVVQVMLKMHGEVRT